MGNHNLKYLPLNQKLTKVPLITAPTKEELLGGKHDMTLLEQVRMWIRYKKGEADLNTTTNHLHVLFPSPDISLCTVSLQWWGWTAAPSLTHLPLKSEVGRRGERRRHQSRRQGRGELGPEPWTRTRPGREGATHTAEKLTLILIWSGHMAKTWLAWTSQRLWTSVRLPAYRARLYLSVCLDTTSTAISVTICTNVPAETLSKICQCILLLTEYSSI